MGWSPPGYPRALVPNEVSITDHTFSFFDYVKRER
jgi:hypothetical protein